MRWSKYSCICVEVANLLWYNGIIYLYFFYSLIPKVMAMAPLSKFLRTSTVLKILLYSRQLQKIHCLPRAQSSSRAQSLKSNRKKLPFTLWNFSLGILRYAPPCVKIREIITSGILGEIVTINHRENVLYWHFAHSFVRGNWRNTESSTFSLMAKCCHDIDLMMYWMGDRKCTSVQSFGNVYHFKESQKPEGAASRCLQCPVEKDCPYSVQKIYLQGFNDAPMWPMSAVCDIEDHPSGYAVALNEALETGNIQSTKRAKETQNLNILFGIVTFYFK